MKRTGNSIGAEGRRQHNENDPQGGDKQRRQERLADREIREAEAERAGEGAREALETSEQADGVPYGEEDVRSAEGVKPATRARIEDADTGDAERDARD